MEPAALRPDFVAIHGPGRSREREETEQLVLGTDIAVCGYTTVSQAEMLIENLELDANSRLLDIGAGCGWPGLHLASRTGCRLVSTDLPIGGLARARERAQVEGLAARATAAAASALDAPFRERSFDSITHADVLC